MTWRDDWIPYDEENTYHRPPSGKRGCRACRREGMRKAYWAARGGGNAMTSWRTQAACHGSDPKLFFPARGEGRGYTEQAKKICQTCPVQVECLEWAVTMREPFGVWGGLSERQRRALRKERAA